MTRADRNRKYGFWSRTRINGGLSIAYLKTGEVVARGHTPYLEALSKITGRPLQMVDARPTAEARVNRRNHSVSQLNGVDVLVLSLPYTEMYDPFIWTRVSKTPTIYLGYAPLWSYDIRLHFQLPIYETLQALVVHSQYNLRGYLDQGLKRDRIFHMGDPHARNLYDAVSCSDSVGRVIDLLWTPHWTQDWYGYPYGYSTWVWAVHSVLAYAREHSNRQVLVRPHPFLQNTINERIMRGLIPESPFGEAVMSWQKLQKLPNVTISPSERPLTEELLSADVLVTDMSTTAMYGSLAGCRVAVTLNSEGPPVSPWSRKVLSEVHHVSDGSHLNEWLAATYLNVRALTFAQRCRISEQAWSKWASESDQLSFEEGMSRLVESLCG